MKLYLKSILMDIKCKLEYKTSFILLTISTALNTFVTFFSAIILLNKFGNIDGWNMNEIIFTMSVAFLGFSVTEMFGRGMDMFYKHVKQGLLDRILVRPRSVTLQVLCSDFEPYKIGRLLESFILLIYGIVTINVKWNLYKIFVLLIMNLGSIVLFFSILVLKASFSFWTIEGMEFMNIISDGGRDVSSYPISIYRKWFADIFTYVIPFGCVNYFPLLYLLGKNDAPFWYGLTPLVTILFMAIAFAIWKYGLTQYK